MLKQKLFYFLRDQEFVTLGTADPGGSPHVSPKLFLKMEENDIYLIDFLVGNSLKNIRQNKKVSVSTFDMENVKGYHVYGTASVIDHDSEFQGLLSEWDRRQTKMATEKVSQTVHGRQNIRSLKLTFLKPVRIYKITIEKIDFVSSQGVLGGEKIQ